MSEKMDVRTAIRIAQSEVLRLERLAKEIGEKPKTTGAENEWAHECADRAKAMRVLIRIGQAFVTAGEE